MSNSLFTLNSGTDAPSLHAKCDNPSVSDFNFMEHWKNKSLKSGNREKWATIPGYGNQYLVSNLGRVMALPRSIITGNGSVQEMPKRILSQGINSTGYCSLRRTFVFNGKATNLAHRLVAIAFIDNPNNYPEVNHLSGDKTNNTVENLEWCTRSQNLRHAADVLDINTGVSHFRSKFSENDVLDIFYAQGTEREIAAKYNVSHSVIGFIKRKKSYKSILSKIS